MEAPVQHPPKNPVQQSHLLTVPRDILKLVCGWLDGRSFIAFTSASKTLQAFAKNKETAVLWQEVFKRDNPHKSTKNITNWQQAVIKQEAFFKYIKKNIAAGNYETHEGNIHELKWRSDNTYAFCKGLLHVSDGYKILTYSGQGSKMGQVAYAHPFPRGIKLRQINSDFFAITGPGYLNFYGGPLIDPIPWGGSLTCSTSKIAFNTRDNKVFLYDLEDNRSDELENLNNVTFFFGLYNEFLFGRDQDGFFVYDCKLKVLEKHPLPFRITRGRFRYPLLVFSAGEDKPVQVYAHHNKRIETLSCVFSKAFLHKKFVFLKDPYDIKRYDSTTGKTTVFAPNPYERGEFLSKDNYFIGVYSQEIFVWNAETKDLVSKCRFAKYTYNPMLKYPTIVGKFLVTLNGSEEYEIDFWEISNEIKKVGTVYASYAGGAVDLCAWDDSHLLCKVRETTTGVYNYRLINFDRL